MVRDTPDPDVSRETRADLQRFHDALLKWNSRINLISKSGVNDVWKRHIWDSAQLVEIAVTGGLWADLGSGGGFPGLVVAIYAKHGAGRHVTLVESDGRKAAFLRTVIRELGLPASVVTQRIEVCQPLGADVVSARALTDLPGLLSFADRHLKAGGTALFLKGETWETEIEKARESWSFDLAVHKSRTNAASAILEVKDIERV